MCITMRVASRRARTVVLPMLALPLLCCVTTATDLHAARDLYSDARYEAAWAWFEALSAEVGAMSTNDAATYHYLRGMTAYRLVQYQEALHELALAADAASAHADALSPSQHSVLDRTLAELMPNEASPYARTPELR